MAQDTTFLELVHSNKTIDGVALSRLQSGRHQFSVEERVVTIDGIKQLNLSFDGRQYVLKFQDGKPYALERDSRVVASVGEKIIMNDKTYVFKKNGPQAFGYYLDGEEVMHGTIMHAKMNRDIYGQYLNFLKYQREYQEALIVLASYYSTVTIDRMIKKKKSFFALLDGVR
ncbi:hypothetical protein DQQ10_17445 [Pseudochryseolinea flava]|uniref:Uncharacterized protein n=2 Tax=Pseudochryseolinea flava TaxID=2059302 RepID=A0A364XZS8_9BACT|nr:hypothetical protein DQQ10_17445 [Pseudochryseolinea flava]